MSMIVILFIQNCLETILSAFESCRSLKKRWEVQIVRVRAFIDTDDYENAHEERLPCDDFEKRHLVLTFMPDIFD